MTGTTTERGWTRAALTALLGVGVGCSSDPAMMSGDASTTGDAQVAADAPAATDAMGASSMGLPLSLIHISEPTRPY